MDDEDIQRIVPREVLVKQGIAAVAHLAGGVFLIIMTMGAGRGFFGIVLSLAALVLGIGALLSKDREEKKPGVILAVAGILGMIMRFRIPLLQPIAGTLLGLGAIGLFAIGIWKGIKFLLGLKSRR